MCWSRSVRRSSVGAVAVARGKLPYGQAQGDFGMLTARRTINTDNDKSRSETFWTLALTLEVRRRGTDVGGATTFFARDRLQTGVLITDFGRLSSQVALVSNQPDF